MGGGFSCAAAAVAFAVAVEDEGFRGAGDRSPWADAEEPPRPCREEDDVVVLCIDGDDARMRDDDANEVVEEEDEEECLVVTVLSSVVAAASAGGVIADDLSGDESSAALIMSSQLRPEALSATAPPSSPSFFSPLSARVGSELAISASLRDASVASAALGAAPGAAAAAASSAFLLSSASVSASSVESAACPRDIKRRPRCCDDSCSGIDALRMFVMRDDITSAENYRDLLPPSGCLARCGERRCCVSFYRRMSVVPSISDTYDQPARSEE